ncbi:MAG: TonB-dependent receptor [Gammaproteobacteria bacterium]|nr:MAG: TonB-dependent receptor [Gammaproteobacteria bacterium]
MYKKNSLALCIALIAAGSSQVFAQSAAPVSDVDEVVVSGVRQAELNAREAERAKNIVSSVISQDDSGNFADHNVAESLQRVPGLTLQKTEGEGQFVSVRGLGPGFVSVSMNGSEMATAGADNRNFSLDALPADMLGSIEVFKSLTPDMDLNSIGGAVNVKTVSAFDKKKDTLRFSAQGSYQDYASAYSPKLTLQGTNLFFDQTVGVSYSLTYEKKETEGYQVTHHQSTDLRELKVDVAGAAPSETMLTPYQFWADQENAVRTRMTGSLDLGWRPTDDSEYYLRVNRTNYEDEDVAMREYYRFDGASTGDVAYINTASNVFGVVDGQLQQQFFIQDGTSSTDTYDIGGENRFGEGWTLDYKLAKSDSDYSKPDGSRVQFRIQHLPMLGQGGEDYIKGQIISGAQMAQLGGVNLSAISAASAGYFTMVEGRSQSKMDYDNLFIEDSFRNDTVDQFAANIKKEFDDGRINYVKAGVLLKSRERTRNKDRWSVDPRLYANFCGTDTQCFDYASKGQLGQFTTFTPNHPDFDYDMITRADAEKLIASTWNTAKLLDVNHVGIDSTKDDYKITEDSQEAYLMAEFQLSDKSSLIAGARYVATQFDSTGNFSIRNDRFEDISDQKLDVAIPLAGTENSYHNLLPSVHYRYEPTEDTLVRAALWTSYTRPGFDQARAFANIADRVQLCNPTAPGGLKCSDDLQGTLGATSTADVQNYYMSGATTLNIGNTHLKPMTSNNLDVSFAWYPNDDLFLQAALYYKQIDDFIVEVNGATKALADLPIALPVDQITQFNIPSDLVFDSVNYTTNGNKADVYGIELSYSQSFTSGLFVQSNLTLIHSSADAGPDVRAGKVQLPDQADETANLVLGWENDDFSVRVIGNYRSKILKELGACPDASASNCKAWADIYNAAATGIDFKATYQITKDIKIYFDALNINNDKGLYYYKGNAASGGHVLYLSEDYGSSYQLGVNIKFK